MYFPFVTLSTDDSPKLLQQLKSRCKRTIDWNKFQSNIITQAQNQYLNYLTDPSFQGVNSVFVLLLENDAQQTMHASNFLLTVEIKDYNVMVDEINQPVKMKMRRYKHIQKIATGQEDYYTNGLFLFQKILKTIAIDSSKQQALDVDLKAIQKISFTRNLEGAENTTIFFMIEEVKETISDFSHRTLRVL